MVYVGCGVHPEEPSGVHASHNPYYVRPRYIVSWLSKRYVQRNLVNRLSRNLTA
jgi:hypothetical protein